MHRSYLRSMDVDEISVITGLDRDRVLGAVHALSGATEPEQRNRTR